MPVFHFICAGCKRTSRRLLPRSPFEEVLKDDGQRQCLDCGALLKWVPEAPSSRVVEVRDNGMMPRKVEQLADIAEIIKERSTEPDEPDTV